MIGWLWRKITDRPAFCFDMALLWLVIMPGLTLLGFGPMHNPDFVHGVWIGAAIGTPLAWFLDAPRRHS